MHYTVHLATFLSCFLKTPLSLHIQLRKVLKLTKDLEKIITQYVYLIIILINIVFCIAILICGCINYLSLYLSFCTVSYNYFVSPVPFKVMFSVIIAFRSGNQVLKTGTQGETFS